MLKEVVELIRDAKSHVAEGTIFCHEVLVTENKIACINELENKNVIENSGYNLKLGVIIDLELSIPRLNSVGYYQNLESLLLRHRYIYPNSSFYVAEIGKFSDEINVQSYTNFKKVVELIDAIKAVSKHAYTDVDIDYAIIFRDDKALSLSFMYSAHHLRTITHEDAVHIQSIVNVLKETNTEKRILFVNELMDFLLSVFENLRFGTLLETISEFDDKCVNAYQYYLRDFSYNKLKIELDSKALEFSQKIQSVINDSQNKLVTIPTAFVLVFVTFNFNDAADIKNISSIISLFIFAILIQIFLNNQFSSLAFIEENLATYRATFSQNNMQKFSQKFNLVSQELSKQKNRLKVVTWILWIIPFTLSIFWLILLIAKPHVK